MISISTVFTPIRRLVSRTFKTQAIARKPAPVVVDLLRRRPTDTTVIYPRTFISKGYADSSYSVFVKPVAGQRHQVQILKIMKVDGFEQYKAVCFIPALGKIKTLPISYSQPLEVVPE